MTTRSPGFRRRLRWRRRGSRAPRLVSNRPPATLIGNAGKPALLRHQAAGGDIDLVGDFERFVETRSARHHDHEVLDIDAAAGMGAAAEDLDFRQRDRGCVHSGQRCDATAERRARCGGSMEKTPRAGDRGIAPSVAFCGDGSRPINRASSPPDPRSHGHAEPAR